MNPRKMILESERLKTFSHWVYKSESVSCTADKMAKAGFYIPNEKDPETAKCFVCMKTLDGWERNDDPFDEHKKHAPYCPFIQLDKLEKDMTVLEFSEISEKMEIALLEARHQEGVTALKQLEEKLIKALMEQDRKNKVK